MSAKTNKLDLRGAGIEILTAGSGEPLLYLHSAGGNIWGSFLEDLAGSYRVVAPTHPGFGGSGGLEGIDTIADLVFHAIDLMNELGLERPIVAGLSLGGWLAAELAVHYPERVSKLVLIDPVGIWVEGAAIEDLFIVDPKGARRLLFHEPESELARMVVPDEPSPEILLEALKARAATARVGWNPFLFDPRLRERLYRVKAPTLVVWGDDDKLVPLAHGHAWAEGIRGAKLEILKNCGHAPVLEKPAETSAAVLRFLKESA